MTVKKPQKTTLIDTFSEGYAAVNRRPWLVLVPILLNLYLWFGVQLSFGPLINDLHTTLQRLQASPSDQSELQAQYTDQLLALGQVDMRQPIAILNFIPTLTLNSITAVSAEGDSAGFPTIQAMPRLIDPQRADTIQIASIPATLLVFLLINLIALPLSAVFLTLLAEAVRGDPLVPRSGLRRSVRSTLAILGYVGVFGGVMLALGAPFLFLALLLIYFSPALGVLMFSLLAILWFWARIYVGFAPEAIVMSGIGPLQALKASYMIVRRNFWSTLGFLALSYVITIGASVIWMTLANSAIGLIIAIIGSAYLSSGLLAARMAFYRERLRRWQSAVATVRPSA